jgi:hypothetical protein
VTQNGKFKTRRKLRPACGYGCRFKCNTKLNKEMRENIFHSFWKLGCIQKQRQFLVKYAPLKKTHKITGIIIQDGATQLHGVFRVTTSLLKCAKHSF